MLLGYSVPGFVWDLATTTGKLKTLNTFHCISLIQEVHKEPPSCTGSRKESHSKPLLPKAALAVDYLQMVGFLWS